MKKLILSVALGVGSISALAGPVFSKKKNSDPLVVEESQGESQDQQPVDGGEPLDDVDLGKSVLKE